MKKNILIAAGLSIVIFLAMLSVEIITYTQSAGTANLLKISVKEAEPFLYKGTEKAVIDPEEFPYLLLEDGHLILRPELISK